MAGDLEKQDGGTEEARKTETKGTPTEQVVKPLTSQPTEALARLELLNARYGVSSSLLKAFGCFAHRWLISTCG